MNNDVKIAKQKLEESRKNYEEGKYNNAVAYCNQALQYVRFISDTDTTKEIYYLLGLAHLELGTFYTVWDINDSIFACKCFDKVIDLYGSFVEAYLKRGIAILRWGNNYELAKADFEKVLELEPNNETAHENLEFCCEQLRKEKESGKMINLEKIKAMTLGIAVADAMGVPVEFKSRASLKRKPVTEMLSYGSHYQPA